MFLLKVRWEHIMQGFEEGTAKKTGRKVLSGFRMSNRVMFGIGTVII